MGNLIVVLRTPVRAVYYNPYRGLNELYIDPFPVIQTEVSCFGSLGPDAYHIHLPIFSF